MLFRQLDTAIRRLAVLTICLLAATAVTSVAALAFPSVRQLAIVHDSPSGYYVGDTIDVSARLYSGASHSVIMFVRSSCTACVAAKPLFRAVATRAAQDAVPVLMAIPNTASQPDIAFAQEIGVEQESVVAISQPVRLKLVPTIVVVDNRGTIVSIYDTSVTASGSIDTVTDRLLAPVGRSSSRRD